MVRFLRSALLLFAFATAALHASPPAGAVSIALQHDGTLDASAAAGFRELRRIVDSEGRAWALLQNSMHPELPLRTVRVETAPTISGPSVYAGELVRIVRNDGGSSLQLSGRAITTAARGEAVRVRIETWSQDEARRAAEITAIALGPGEVEWRF